jgi:hypothetical protein
MADFLPFTRPSIDEATIAGVAEVLRSPHRAAHLAGSPATWSGVVVWVIALERSR